MIAYTEATSINACFRLKKLGIEKLFTRIYSCESTSRQYLELNHNKSRYLGRNRYVELSENISKPDASILVDIVGREGFELCEACYVGDSLSKDIYMAKSANITSVWAKYGTKYDTDCWDVLVKVSHWSDEDIKREEENKINAKGVIPDYILNSFSDLNDIV